MRAVLCKAWGGPEDLVVEQVPMPRPGRGEIRVAVEVAGVNFADTLMIAGQYQEKPAFPFSPGLECAGVVDALGDGVDGVAIGDRVMAVAGHGAFAEAAVMPADRVFPIPDVMPFDIAAAFPVAYGTSHLALCHRAGLSAGEVLLVHGAAGGVGLTAVEIGKTVGATVIATAGGADKLAVAAEYGADHLIDYRNEDVRDVVLRLTGGSGADVVYDPVGGEVFDASLRCTAWEGRILVIGFASGKIPSAPVNRLMVKNFSVLGVYWGAYLARDPKTVRASFADLLGWYAAGRLRPHVSRRLPLERAAEALDMLRARRSTGKVVLTVSGD